MYMDNDWNVNPETQTVDWRNAQITYMDNDWKVNPETQTLSSACVLLYLLLETFLLRLQFVQQCYLHILTELTCAFLFVCFYFSYVILMLFKNNLL